MALQQGLKNIRVVDFSNRIAGHYCSKMFVDAGAEVIKIEPEAGDPLRLWSASNATFDGDSAFFQFLNTGKLSVSGKINDQHIQELINSADLIINTFKTDSDAFTLLEKRRNCSSSQQVWLSISDYGRQGSYANRPATEFTVQADSGSLSTRGLRSQPPVMAGGKITEYVGGTFAAVAALAATHYAQESGYGEHIDFSLMEVISLAGTAFADLMASLWGRPDIPGKLRNVEVPSIEPTKDGWVGFATNSFQQFSDFLVMIGRPDLLEDKELHTAMGRSKHMQQWNDIVHTWTKQHSTQEIIDLAAALRIPVAQVNNGKTVFDHEQFKARGVFVKNPSGDFLQPRTPYLINGETPFDLKPSPSLGEHNDSIFERKSKSISATEERHLPLKGIRILDATAWWAGPSSTHMLACLGAEVIHLEAIQRPDGSRMMGGLHGKDVDWWEYSAMFLSVNANKQGLTLNLDDPQGIEVAKKLITTCDVFVENYSPRVMENFGLDWDTVHQLNPKTIMVRMPAFGLDGPWKNHVGFAQTMEQITGMAWLTGHVDDQPRIQRGPCDPMAGMNAAFAILAALEERKLTGKGSHIECSMVEGALNAAAEQAIEYSAYGNVLQRNGNRSPDAAPQGLYFCANHPTPEDRKKPEQWLALSIETDEQWQTLKNILGNPEWTNDSALDTLQGRIEQQNMLDAQLQETLAKLDLQQVIEQWRQAGIPVAPVTESTKTYTHPQMAFRKFFETQNHPVVGEQPISSVPFRFDSVNQWLYKTAPTVGEDNSPILGMLGYSEQDIQQFMEYQVIGNHLLGVD